VLSEIPFVIIFFSALWCPPCVGFLPCLKEFYEKVNQIDLRQHYTKTELDFPNYSIMGRTVNSSDTFLNVEIFFVSLDASKHQFQEHMIDQGNWMCLANDDPRAAEIKDEFQITSVPILSVVDTQTGRIISKNARQDIFLRGEQVIWEWLSKSSYQCFKK